MICAKYPLFEALDPLEEMLECRCGGGHGQR